MDLEKWAEKEIKIACKKENPDRAEGEWDYGCACYESALKVARIHTVVQIRELINTIQELEGIANVGILETMCDEQLKDKCEERINIHSNIIDINNDIANVFSQLVEDILGEQELNNISVQVQLDNII